MQQKKVQFGKVLWELKTVVALAVGICGVLMGAVYVAYRLANERAYREKWKDYNDCGLM